MTTHVAQVSISAMTDTRKMHLEFLDKALEALRIRSNGQIKALSGLAKECGISPSTLYRFQSEPERSHLSDSMISLISQATGVPLPSLRRDPGEDGEWFEAGDNGMSSAGIEAGDEVLAAPDATLDIGDLVVAQVFAARGRVSRFIVRAYHPPFLAAATKDPKLLEPIPIRKDENRIIGAAIKMRRERDLR